MKRRAEILFNSVVYDIGGLFVVLGGAIGSGLNRAPLWQALIAPVLYMLMIGFLEPQGVTYSRKVKVRRALLLGALAFIVALSGFYLGPHFVDP